MHDEGRLLVRHLHGVVDGTGNGTGDHAAQAAGGEDRQAQQPGEQVGTPLGLDDAFVLHNDIDEAVDAAGLLDQMDHSADHQNGADDDDIAAAHVIHDGIQAGVDADQGAECVQHEGAGEDTEKQRNEDVLRGQGQDDRQQRGNEGPKSVFHRVDLLIG